MEYNYRPVCQRVEGEAAGISEENYPWRAGTYTRAWSWANWKASEGKFCFVPHSFLCCPIIWLTWVYLTPQNTSILSTAYWQHWRSQRPLPHPDCLNEATPEEVMFLLMIQNWTWSWRQDNSKWRGEKRPRESPGLTTEKWNPVKRLSSWTTLLSEHSKSALVQTKPAKSNMQSGKYNQQFDHAL